MLCPYCAHEIKEDAKFCAKCGHKIARCPTCNRVLTTRAGFCLNDGTPIPEELIKDLPAAGSASPSVRPEPKKIVISQTPQKRYCKRCGKMCDVGQVLCPDCLSAQNRKRPVSENEYHRRQWILPVVLGTMFILLLGGVALGAGIVTGKTPIVSANNQNKAAEVDSKDAGKESDEKNEIDLNTEKENDSSEADYDIQIADDKDSKNQEISVLKDDSEEEKHRYEVVAADISWSDANEKASQSGGHLATITSSEEFEEVCAAAEKSGLKYLWIGALLISSDMDWDDGSTWITREKWTFDKWYPGEPSKEDTDGTKENYLCLWKAQYEEKDIGWTFNDQRNNLVEDFPELAGQVGYIIEYGDGLEK